MKLRKISLQVVLTASTILIIIELFTAGIISRLGIYPLSAICIARVIGIASMIFILIYLGNGLKSVGLLRENIARGFSKGFAWAAAFGLFALLFLGILHFAGFNILTLFASRRPQNTFHIFLLFFVGGLISPVAEELYFRGIVYVYLRKWGVIMATLGSSILFSMVHLLTSGVSPVQVIGGLVFAIAYEVEKNLLVPITIHVLGNMAIFTLSLLLLP